MRHASSIKPAPRHNILVGSNVIFSKAINRDSGHSGCPPPQLCAASCELSRTQTIRQSGPGTIGSSGGRSCETGDAAGIYTESTHRRESNCPFYSGLKDTPEPPHGFKL